MKTIPKKSSRDGVQLDHARASESIKRPLVARLGIWAWLLPALTLIVIVQLLPMLYALWLSFQDKLSLERTGTFIGLKNYVDQLAEPEFWNATGNGLIYGFGSVAVQLVFGLATALLLHRTFRGRGIARGLTLLPYMIPSVTAALIFALMFDSIYGIVNQVLVGLNLIDGPILFFGDQNWAMLAVIFTAAWKWTPFAIIVLLARLQTIDGSLYECARVEGAGAMRSFLDITLPSLRGSIFLIVLLRSIWMFNKFDIPYLLTQGGPLGETETLPIYAYRVGFEAYQQGAAASLAVIMGVFLLIFAVPYFRIFRPEEEVSPE